MFYTILLSADVTKVLYEGVVDMSHPCDIYAQCEAEGVIEIERKSKEIQSLNVQQWNINKAFVDEISLLV